MDIRKVDSKPMVIHQKEKAKLHVKRPPEPAVKGTAAHPARQVPEKPKEVQVGYMAGGRKPRQEKGGTRAATEKEAGQAALYLNTGPEIRAAASRKGEMQKKKAAVKRKEAPAAGGHPVPASIAHTVSSTALGQLEGGEEVSDAYTAAGTLAGPAIYAAGAGQGLYRIQAARAKRQGAGQRGPGSRAMERAARESAIKAVKKKAQKAAKETAREAGKKAAKETAKAAAKTAGRTAAAAAGTAVGSPLAGAAAGEIAGIAMDRRDVQYSTRARMVKLAAVGLGQGESQDTVGKAVKDIIRIRVSMAVKYTVRYLGPILLALFAVTALIALLVTALITLIYNSPLAILFPSISSGETAQEVLSAYVAEFNDTVDAELLDCAGYDRSEKIYVNFEGAGRPDNFCDILMVYMVRYGKGDTATDMTDPAKQNLKAVFDDMCSYTVASRDGEDGGKVKAVQVELKSCYDMVPIYGFDEGEQAMLASLMAPEALAMLGYPGGGGDPGEAVPPEQYQAIVDSISDENGKRVVAYALSKVGYPYSQTYRDTGDYYDCSSLAYYAWKSAGVDLMYEGANTAASEGKYCYDRNLLVHYEEMQPGDLIFYSYDRNDRFMDITHVAIYVGDGMVVEAANSQVGVVYREVQGRPSIVLIGRPR